MNGGMGGVKALSALILVALMIVLPLKAVGAESNFACGTIDCDEMTLNPSDKASLQSGAKLFVNYCMGCHAAQYSRWGRVAQDLQIPEQLVMDNLVFADQQIGELMKISMPYKEAGKWFGAPPPDLTLMARVRSPEWLYTYLRNFYVDPLRGVGVNNRVFPDVAMPHVLMDLQGLQQCAPGPVRAANGGIKQDPLTGEAILDNPCGNFTLVKEGSMTPEEFDGAVYDLVNFMGYMANPVAEKSRTIGIYVLLFLSFLLVWVLLLNREYWKDVH
jgi:ubiquinol-cytochrome c reductase cytochrome b subunit